MKHARKSALAAVEPLLRRLRSKVALVESTPGAFYRKSSAYLHFHEDPSGTFVDVKLDGKIFERFRVSTKEEQLKLLARIDAGLDAPT